MKVGAQAPVTPFRYRAFISYSHQDERWGAWLHKALERYRVPRRLVGRVTAAGVVPARLAPVFRDREELATATDLGRIVNAALEQSAALVVVCSPAAAASRWVGEEVRAFRRLGRGERIFCLIVGGAPEADGAEQCFPDALREPLEGLDAGLEPIAADVRLGKDGQRSALLKLVAGLLDVGLDELVRRDLQRRHRRLAAVASAAITGMILASVLAGAAWVARNEAERQRARAETEAATAQQTSEFLVQLFQVVDPSEARGATVTAREILDRGAARIDRDLQAQPIVRANLLQTMGRVYTGLGLYRPATELLERARGLRAELADAPTPQSIATANALGAALRLKGEYTAAAEAYRNALAGAETLFPNGAPETTEAMNGVADVLTELGEFAAAEEQYRAALQIDRRLHGARHPDVARTEAGLALALLYQKRYDESETELRDALATRQLVLGEDHPLVAETLNNLASLLYFAGRSEEAEPYFRQAADLYRKILGPEHPFVSSILNNLGRLLLERGDLERAEPFLEDALAMDRKFKDPQHDELVYTLENLGLIKLGLNKTREALPLLEEARSIGEQHSHRMLGQVWGSLADAYWRLARYDQAIDAIAHARQLVPDEPWRAADLDGVEGAVAVARGNLDQGEPVLVRSYQQIAEKWGEKSIFTRLAANRLSALYQKRGNPALVLRYSGIAQATRTE